MTDPIEMLATLVGFDTVSSKSNLDLIHFISDRLADVGVEATILPNADGTKANMFATIGPKQQGRRLPDRPYRCRAGGRPTLGHRPVFADRQR